jgi:hypothetical protein
MSEKRKKANWPIVAAVGLIVVALPLTAYVEAYLAMSNLGRISTQYESKACRFYSAQWQADLFWPAAQLESILAGHEIKTGHIPAD